MTGLHIVWFRHDLRVHDHAALRAACHSAERDGGSVLALYTMPSPDLEGSAPNQFLIEALRDLQVALDRRGAQLHLRYGAPGEVFSELHRRHGLLSLHCHETPEASSEDRDMEAWAIRAGVAYRVYQQFGPLPASTDFFEADSSWEHFMASPRREAADISSAAEIGVGQWPDLGPMPSDPSLNSEASCGGRKQAVDVLRAFLGSPATFLDQVGQPMPSGAAGYQQLKPHLALGTVSLREAWQAAMSARQQYLGSGHEIRAATIATFIECLPSLYLEKYRSKSRPREDYRSETRQRRAVGQQLSLGFLDQG